MVLVASSPLIHALWGVVHRFGAFAFFPLGLLDMSVLPTPGSFDALLIVLAAAHPELWWYYALMAAAASVLGAWPSFALARRGGEEAMEKRLGPHRSRRVFAAFERWGFWSMFVGAVAPPPMPASAFVVAAGAMKYPWPRFLLAWTSGRLLRFTLVGWVAAQYGRRIFHWFSGYYRPALWTVTVMVVLAGAAALWFYVRARRQRAAHLAREAGGGSR
jgi:membrane protein YqaA with SNARE-associated domain